MTRLLTTTADLNWAEVHTLERRPVPRIAPGVIPTEPGVYVLYRDGAAAYIGKATRLRDRIWKCHLRRGRSMTNSAMRRNVAEFLGIASAADIKSRRYAPTDDDARRVSGWIDEGELAWTVCESALAAEMLEKTLKAEWLPPLTKR